MKIFWSWQSDRIPKNHHYFVRDALTRACELIMADAHVEESDRPEVDHDTKDVAGTPDIVRSIAEKIDAAAAFVADMTPVAVTDPAGLRPDLAPEKLPKPKHVQNANVMSELGYAEKSLTLDKIVLVANAAHYPGPDALPFDWRNRRGPVTYTLADDADNATRTRELETFAKALRDRLGGILQDRRGPTIVRWHEPSATDTALWAGSEDGLRMRTGGRLVTYSLPPGGRLTIRIVPGRWSAPPINALEAKLSGNNRPVLHLGGSNGDFGPNKEGALHVWGSWDKQTDAIKARTATQWFQDNGEIWAADTVTFGTGDEGAFFAFEYAMPRLGIFIDNAVRALGEFGSGPFLVQIHARGLVGTSWPGHWMFDRMAALKDEAHVEAQLRTDSPLERQQLLMKFWNAIADAYGMPPAETLEQFEEQAKLIPVSREPA
jgi:hypothetical protein